MDDHRKKVLKALEAYTRDNTSRVFIKARRLLGFPGPASKREDIDSLVESADIISIHMGQLPPPLDGPALYPEIRSAILECQGNERELEFFICDVINKFSGISAYVFPKVKHKCWDDQIAALTLFKTTDHYNPADSLIAEWRKYEQYCVPDISAVDLEAAVQHRLNLFHEYFKSDIQGTVHQIIESMKTVASLIDAALLENESSLDFFHFQKAAHCVLTYELDSYDISDNAGVNRDRIDEKIFIRTYYDDLAPQGLLLPELRDQINDYRNNGTWNFTKRTYLDIIAAPEDIRQINLNTYLSAYRNYVLMMNEDGILRELLAVFYDLFQIWEDVRAWYKKTTFFPYPCRDMVNLFRQQAVHHIAVAYFIYMCYPKSCRFDIYTLYPGITKEEVKDFICNQFHFLSPAEFDRHEFEIASITPLYQPFTGYYSGEEKQAETAEKPASAPAPQPELQPQPEDDVEDIPAEGKNPETEKYRNAHHLYQRLCGLKLLKSRGDDTYNWIWKGTSEKQSRVSYSYLCFMFWRFILREHGQIDRAVFCSVVHSRFKQDTIGTYALDFRRQLENSRAGITTDGKRHKVLPPTIKKSIDDLFEELEKLRYFDKPY